MSDTLTVSRPSTLGALKSKVARVPLARRAYVRLRSPLDRRAGAEEFENVDDYVRALRRREAGGAVLRCHDGLRIAIRRNTWDAEIVREIFFERPYTRRVTLAPNPVVVDVGGYIGDFALYAVKRLNASRVVAYEPTAENFELLTRNVELNGYGDRITAVNKAVGRSGEVSLNVRRLAGDEIHVSSYWYPDAEQRSLPSDSLEEVLDRHDLDSVDLLKVDCEGGEYDIFPDVPDAVYARIRNIVFEYHAIDGYAAMLARVIDRLSSAGYRLRRDGYIITAARG